VIAAHASLLPRCQLSRFRRPLVEQHDSCYAAYWLVHTADEDKTREDSSVLSSRMNHSFIRRVEKISASEAAMTSSMTSRYYSATLLAESNWWLVGGRGWLSRDWMQRCSVGLTLLCCAVWM